MKKYFLITTLALVSLGGCKRDSEFLNVQTFSILTNEQAFSDPAQVLSIMADLYNRQVDFSSFTTPTLGGSWLSFSDFSESFPSENAQAGIVQRNSWGFGEWATWDYNYIRDLNLFIERATEAKTLSEGEKARFISEARFLRANYYFELAKRMGGVPLITKSLSYDFKGDPSYLQQARAKESDIYDFVISEAEAIKGLLPANLADKSRASKGAALAMEARAALYAGSIAKYGINTPQVSLTGGEVGIPSSRATGYYTTALKAAQEIINGSAGPYALYKVQPNLSENFASIFLDKSNANPETIWVQDFKIRSGRVSEFTIRNQPRFGAEEEEGGRINPSLNLVQSFEKLDNTFAPLPIKDALGNPILYTNPADLFAGRDARLAGTVMIPGSSFKNRAVDIFAGVQLADGTVITGDDRGAQKVLPGMTTPTQVVGFDGPVSGKEHSAQTGFYLRKYVDPSPGAGSRGTGSEKPFIRYRFAEVLLNAAEAAFELGQPAVAAGYMNQVRARAGLIIPLTPGEITFDRIVHERRAELSFEGHVLFDRKRWRIAHIVWDGVKMTETDLLSNIGQATKRNTQPYALWPYKYYEPSSPNNGKWLFKIILPSLVTGANRFQLGNYYSAIDVNIMGNNPKLVRQPNQ